MGSMDLDNQRMEGLQERPGGIYFYGTFKDDHCLDGVLTQNSSKIYVGPFNAKGKQHGDGIIFSKEGKG